MSLINVDKFRFFSQVVLPAVYDESLSYYEVLNKVRYKLNEIVDSTNAQNETIRLFINDVNNNFDDFVNKIIGEYDSSKEYNKGYYCWYNNKVYKANDDTTGVFDDSKWDEVIFGDAVADDVNNYIEKVDNLISQIAPAYRNYFTYKVGEMCVYNDVVYVCTTAINPPENFNPEHWNKAVITTELKNRVDNYWEEFIDNYERTFGIVQTTGDSVTDAISQKGFTDELNKNTLNINNGFLNKELVKSITSWENGVIRSTNGTNYTSTSRIRTGYIKVENIHSFNCSEGYKYAIYAYSNFYATDYIGIFNGNTYPKEAFWFTGKTYLNNIDKNYYLRIVFAKTDDSDVDLTIASNFICYTGTDKELNTDGVPADAKAVGQILSGLSNVVSYNLSQSKLLEAGDDCDLLNDGSYYYNSSNVPSAILHAPTYTAGFRLEQYSTNGSTRKIQIAFVNTSIVENSGIYVRRKPTSSSAFSDWFIVANREYVQNYAQNLVARYTPPTKIKVIQNNIGKFRWGHIQANDEQIYGLTEEDYQIKVNNYRRMFAKYQPDIMGFQEWNTFMDKAHLHNSAESLFTNVYNEFHPSVESNVKVAGNIKCENGRIILAKGLQNADVYNSSETYNINDFCKYNDVVYRCIANTTGAFNANSWVALDDDTLQTYDSSVTYNVNDMCKRNDYIYKCINTTTGAFDPNDWTNLGPATTNYYNRRWYIIDVIINNHTVAFLTGALQFDDAYSNSQYVRKKQIADIISQVSAYDYVIITSDLNSVMRQVSEGVYEAGNLGEILEIAENAGYTAANKLDGYWGVKSTYVNHTTGVQSPTQTLDNILVKGNINITNFKVLDDEYNNLASDHIPIFAELYIY